MKQLNADIVVASGGTAGMAAAVAAAQKGAKVIIFEKLASTGGTPLIGGSGPFAVESRLQKLKHLTLSREEAFKIYMDFNHWRVNAALVRALVDKSGDTIDWLEKLGVEFFDVASHNPGFHHTFHLVKTEPGRPQQAGGSLTMMKILTAKANELGVTTFLKTPVQKLIKENGRITGVFAQDTSTGEEIRVNAKAVILATGGWGGPFRVLKSLTGDGIKMAREAGAQISKTYIQVLMGGAPPGEGQGTPSRSRPPANWSIMFAFQQPNLMVNLLGERFMNEEVLVYTPFASNAIARQKDQTAFMIFDHDSKTYYEEHGFDFYSGGVQAPAMKVENFDNDVRAMMENGHRNLFAADSIQELSSQTGIDLNGLTQTITEYNNACQTGHDKVFNKNVRYLRTIMQPKFYAHKTVVNQPGESEGIKVNHKTEVIGVDYKVIPGLYAAGMEIASELYNGTYPYSLPGTALGFALNSGRIAAENAVNLDPRR